MNSKHKTQASPSTDDLWGDAYSQLAEAYQGEKWNFETTLDHLVTHGQDHPNFQKLYRGNMNQAKADATKFLKKPPFTLAKVNAMARLASTAKLETAESLTKFETLHLSQRSKARQMYVVAEALLNTASELAFIVKSMGGKELNAVQTRALYSFPPGTFEETVAGFEKHLKSKFKQDGKASRVITSASVAKDTTFSLSVADAAQEPRLDGDDIRVSVYDLTFRGKVFN